MTRSQLDKLLTLVLLAILLLVAFDLARRLWNDGLPDGYTDPLAALERRLSAIFKF